MTNAEAIETLRANYPDACYEQLREAVDAAIEALTALQTDGDCISKQTVFETSTEYENELREILGDENELVEVVKILKHRLIALPSVQPEPCDAISRADAIRVASGYCHPANVAKELAKLPSAQAEPHYTDDQIQKMQDLEQAQLDKAFELGRKNAKWIPCSERLPEAEKKHYWVCTDTGYQCQCRWTNINHIWTDLTTEWHWHIMDIPQYSKVIAWMPLPEPYREEGE